MKYLHSFLGLWISCFVLSTCCSAQLSREKVIYGAADLDQYGAAVDAVGDMNSDGIPDYIVGIRFNDFAGAEAGSAEIISGSDGTILRTFYGDSAGDNFGTAVAGLGDIDGDGTEDVIVGSPLDDFNGNTDCGSIRVLSGATGTTIFTLYGQSANELLGSSVCDSLDVNNDGVPDFAAGIDDQTPGATIAHGVIVYSGTDGSVLHSLGGTLSFKSLKYSVSAAGDLNGDGFADIFVGAKDDNTINLNAGQARVFSGQDGSAIFAAYGVAAHDNFGVAVSSNGDVDNDGVPDLAIGADGAAVNGPGAGAVLVFSGATGTILHTFSNEIFHYAKFGSAVSIAGDVDGDGCDDIIVGAQDADYNGAGTGSVFVYSGFDGVLLGSVNGDRLHSDFGASVSFLGDVNNDGLGDIVVGCPKGGNTVTHRGSASLYTFSPDSSFESLVGDSAGDEFGSAVSCAGDVDGDGINDFIVGSPLDDSNGESSGSARVFSGADGHTFFTVYGAARGYKLGNAVGGAGDVNGDGFDDVIVGSRHEENSHQGLEAVFVYSGVDGSILHSYLESAVGDLLGSSVNGVGDINNDGFDDFLIGKANGLGSSNNSGIVQVFSGQTGAVLMTLNGVQPYEQFGFAAACAGDVNGDGVTDIIVGSIGHANYRGKVEVFSGASGARLHSYSGNFANDIFGYSVGGVGDVDRDGFDDFIVGAPSAANGTVFAGTAKVYSGFDGSVLFVKHGGQGDGLGSSVGSAGDYNGDGFPDFMAGSPGDDGGVPGGGSVKVYSGRNGNLLDVFYGATNYERLGHSSANLNDISGDGFSDLIAGSLWNNDNGFHSGRVTVKMAPTLPAAIYSSDLGPTRLHLYWVGNLGDPHATTGRIVCSQASPGGLGIFGVSLAPTNFQIFGFPLLIANDPVNLINSGGYGFGLDGRLVVTNVTRQVPALAGVHIFIQHFEMSPIISSSNGLALLLVP